MCDIVICLKQHNDASTLGTSSDIWLYERVLVPQLFAVLNDAIANANTLRISHLGHGKSCVVIMRYSISNQSDAMNWTRGITHECPNTRHELFYVTRACYILSHGFPIMASNANSKSPSNSPTGCDYC